MHFLSEYGLFLTKAITTVLAVLLIAAGIFLIAVKSKVKEKAGKLTLHKLNDQYESFQNIISEGSQNKAELKRLKKMQKALHKQHEKQIKKRLFVLHFNGDIKASAVVSLREEVTAILLSKTQDDEVLLCVDSPGGMVNAYGLAAAQVQRLKDAKIKLTIAVDKMAASGGYMMACLADRLIAAPFAVIGSIGVVAQLPNFHRWLDKKDIDFEQILAGQYKRTLTLFGKNTEEGREKLQEEVNDIHELFKNFISRYRPEIDINQVATGEHWFAIRAIDLKLIDEIKTSDDFLLAAKDHFDIFQLQYCLKKTFSQRLGSSMALLLNKVLRIETAAEIPAENLFI